MGILWTFVLFLCVRHICSQKLENLMVTDTINDSKISFRLEWISNLSDIFSYVVYTCILSSFHISKRLGCSFFIIKHQDYGNQNKYLEVYDFNYYPSTTYDIQVGFCKNSNARKTIPYCRDGKDVTNCTNITKCTYSESLIVYTRPLKPIIKTNKSSCNDSRCQINVNIMNFQASNSSLYILRLEHERPIDIDLINNIRQMKENSASQIGYNTPDTNVIFNKTDWCNKNIYLLFVNDYFGFLNFTSEYVQTEQVVDCASSTQSTPLPNETELTDTVLIETVTNETLTERIQTGTRSNEDKSNYYPFIIAIVLITTGIVGFIKRKSLYKIYNKYTQPEMETSEPLVLTRPEKPKKLRHPSRVITSESLKSCLESNPAKFAKIVANEFTSVPEDVSQKIYGEAIKDKNRYKNVLPCEGTITSANVTKAEIGNNVKNATLITFSLEWRSHHENIYSYSINARVFESSNDIKGTLRRKILINHEDGKTNYSTNFSVKYYPSTTYEIRFACCGYNAKADNSVSNCTVHNLCKLQQQKVYYRTSPITPKIQFKNVISCDDTTCEIDVNLKRIQTRNSSLYVFKQKNEGGITLDVVKNIKEMKDINAIEIPWSDPNNVKVMFNKTDVCNFTIYLILVNDYFGLQNYTTIHLPKESINCISTKQILLVANETNGNSTRQILPVTPEINGKSTKQSLQVPHETNGNYYYLLIIPIALIAIGIITFIKRKSLYKFYRKFTTNQPRIEATNVPLLLKTILVEEPKKLIQKFQKQPKQSFLTPETLKKYLEGNPSGIISNLTTEFENVPEDDLQKVYGESFEDKNRYKNIIPYVKYRVVLNLLENKVDSHYINASYIKGYQNDKKYIATQGPTTKTLGDFWRMIWQEQTTLIIMLTNLKENGSKKCEQYWPDKGVKSYENYTVAHQRSQKHVEYTRRDFVLSHKNTNRNVTQLHFTIWPDKGIPDTPYSLVKFLKESRTHVDVGPIVVHCSAGIGRSGTFILCDYIIDSLLDVGEADFPQALFTLRECRKNMVQYAAQYLYSYCVVNEFLNGNQIDISVEEFKENNVSEAKFVETFKNIQNSDYWLNILYPAAIHHGYSQNKNKHRMHEKPPKNSTGFISLQRYPNSDKESFYVDAVAILNEAGNIISTSQPLPNTLSAFWRLIVEKNISVVLSLQDLDVNDETSIKFWPTTGETLNPVDFITLTLVECIADDAYDSFHIKLDDLKHQEVKYVFILHFKNWKRNSLPTINDFLLYHKHFTGYLRKQPILVACYDATDASSVFITFLYLLEKLKRNMSIDLNTAISTLKIYRKNFNLDTVKLKFVYDVMHGFLQDLSTDFYKDTDEIYENLKKG